jgi:hypothetical protein
MKKLVALSVMVLMLCSMPVFSGNYDQSYERLDNILRLGGILYNECKKRDMEIVKIDIDIVGKNSPKQTLKKMSSEFNYDVCCVGDPERIKDLDIKVFYVASDGTLVLVTKDTKVDPTAEVTIEHPTSGSYLIEIEAYEMQTGYENGMSYYYLTVAHN